MGQGYVGLPLAMAAAEAGHNVIGFEPQKERYDALVNCHSYVEDVTSLRIMEAMARATYKPSANEQDLEGFDIAIITVPTPLLNGEPDLSYVKAAASTLGLYLREGATVVLESTTYPGTTEEVVIPLLEAPSELIAGQDFHVGFSPERIDPGNKTWHFGNTPKIVSGLTPVCLDKVASFYASITSTVVESASLKAAELAKVYENIQRQVGIALANELQRHAHTLGVDVHEVLQLCATKPFGYTPFTPGPGVGGHCIPCDPMYLTYRLRTEHNAHFRIVELAQEINDGQPSWVVRRLQDALNKRGLPLQGSRILALGQAYKADTADMRESPAVAVADLLVDLGAQVDRVDPFFEAPCSHREFVEIPPVVGNDDYRHLCDEYNAVVLLTPHSAFDLRALADSGVYVLDTRGVMPDAPNIERL